MNEVFVLFKLNDKAIPPTQNIHFPSQTIDMPIESLRSTLQVNFLSFNYQSGEPLLCTDTISNTILRFIHSRFMV